MKTFSINDDALCGEAYNSAINNVIKTVNKLGWNWDYYNNLRDAHQLAEEMNIRFNIDGEYV